MPLYSIGYRRLDLRLDRPLTFLDVLTKKKSFLWASTFVSSSMLVFSLLNLFVSMTIIG